jgi:hypothetical protein
MPVPPCERRARHRPSHGQGYGRVPQRPRGADHFCLR